MKKALLAILKIILGVYVVVCAALFFLQERMIFFPEVLNIDHRFRFDQKFEELRFKTADGDILHGLLFKADTTKGLIFYLHGNAGSVDSWGRVAEKYTALNYDVFILDYRGYGKSEGNIFSEEQFFSDAQMAYDAMKERYDESKICIFGYSIGTGVATRLAADNRPKMLVLHAPYYSLVDMMKKHYPIIPTFILKYRFETNRYLVLCTMPVVIFHGNADEVIPSESSEMLKESFKPSDRLVILEGQGHNGISDNPVYIREINFLVYGSCHRVVTMRSYF
jgi:alpha-beta hydrolase superfamily lysophospholipase